jgi:diaminopimelate epimerase
VTVITRRLGFEKWQGLGNDFLVVDAHELEPEVGDEVIRALCDRRFGVGGDGVLIVGEAEGVDATMIVRNADGSRPEMCGNGLRCVVGALQARGRIGKRAVVRTDAGDLECLVEREGDEGRVSVEVAMGRVSFGEQLSVDIDGEMHRFVTASIGNPHAVTFERYGDAERDRVAPIVEKSPAGATNVEFVRVEGTHIDVVVWERGVGYTLACGTGACAVAAVAVHEGRAPRGEALRVSLPGGELAIRVDPSDWSVRMRGPAVRVFEGTTSIDGV